MCGIADLDITNSPYAEWLEGVCKSVMKLEPQSIALVATGIGDGIAMTAYYEAGVREKSEMIHHILSDYIMEIIENNADNLKNIILGEDDEDATDDEETGGEEEWYDWRDT